MGSSGVRDLEEDMESMGYVEEGETSKCDES